jgi:hypothetical protein
MSARHLKRAIESGGFVVAPHEGRYDLLCTGGNDIYTQCGLRRLVCVSEFERFSLHHLPNKYVGVFGISRRELALQAATLERLAGGQGWRGSLVEPETSTPAGSWWKNLYAPAQASLLELIPVSARRILVIGVGSGAAEAPLVKRADRVVVIPLDAVVGQGASWRGMEVLDGGLDAALRSLSSDRFDCLVFPWVLHLAADPVEWIRRCSALLEPEGTLVFSIPKMGDVSLRAPKLAPRPNGRYITRRWRLWTSLRRALQVRRWLRSAEFRVVETRSFELGLPDEPVSMLRGLWRDLLASGFVVCAKRRAAR